MGGINQADLQANIQNIMNNRNIPPELAQQARQQMMPQADPDNLIFEDQNIALEQEAIMEHIMNMQQPDEEEDIIINDAGDDEVRKQNE
jgi:hypothetical protein